MVNMHIAETPQAGSPPQSIALREKQGTHPKKSTPQGSRELPRIRHFFLLPLPVTQKAMPDRVSPFAWWEEVDSNYRSQ